LVRSGTLGLYRAMQILGFKPYHLYECVAVHGVPHMQVFHEAIVAQYNRIAGVKKFTQSDFENWLGDYDVSRLVSFSRSIQFEH
jgi:hypothetical protein